MAALVVVGLLAPGNSGTHFREQISNGVVHHHNASHDITIHSTRPLLYPNGLCIAISACLSISSRDKLCPLPFSIARPLLWLRIVMEVCSESIANKFQQTMCVRTEELFGHLNHLAYVNCSVLTAYGMRQFARATVRNGSQRIGYKCNLFAHLFTQNDSGPNIWEHLRITFRPRINGRNTIFFI